MDTVTPDPNMDRKCPHCGTPLEPGALGALCPACLLKAGVAADTVSDARQPAFNPPSAADLAPLFPQLEILELIGKGGMGAVYKARQRQLDRFVALKILPPGIGNDPAFAERFAREAKALAKLNHPGIVTLYEFGVASGMLPAAAAGFQPGGTNVVGSERVEKSGAASGSDANPGGRMPPSTSGRMPDATSLYFFLMEYVDGVNLKQLLHASRISAHEALAIVPQICDALQFAHDQGIVHRDIKPENILMDRRGRVKVADFGLAKIIANDAPLTLSLSPSDGERVAKPGEGSPVLTDAGKVMGTPQYMSPEQIQAPGEVDHRADIYALGVVFYQMLTGELPGKRLEAPSKKVQIDVRLDEVVLRALEKNPALRYQQVSEVKTLVETIVATTPVGSGCESAQTAPAAMRDHRWELAALVTGTIVVVSLLLAVVMGTAVSPFVGVLVSGLCIVSLGICALSLAGLWPIASPWFPKPNFSSRNLRRQAGNRIPSGTPGFQWAWVAGVVALHAVGLLACLGFLTYEAPRIIQLFADQRLHLPAATQWTVEFYRQASRGIGLLLVAPVLVAIDIGLCWLAQRLGGRKLLLTWGGAVLVGLALFLGGNLWLLNLPLRELQTIKRQERNERVLAVLQAEPVQEEVLRRLRAANVEFSSPNIHIKPEHNQAIWYFGELKELRQVGGTNVWTPIQGTLTQRVLPDGSWEVQGEGDLKHIRFGVGAAASPAAANGPTFGPVVERVVTDILAEPTQACLDFRSGEFKNKNMPLHQLEQAGSDYEWRELESPLGVLRQWIKKEGVDLVGCSGTGAGGARFRLFGNLVYRISDTVTFDNVLPSEVAQYSNLPTTNSSTATYPGIQVQTAKLGERPATDATFIVFKTEDGDAGVMQITGFTGNPCGVKIRYKLVQPGNGAGESATKAPQTSQTSNFQFRRMPAEGDTNSPADVLNHRTQFSESSPLLDKERPFESITAAATALIAKYFPDAKVTAGTNVFTASHATREFQIYSRYKTGDVSTNSYKKTGPTAEGFVLTIYRMDEPYRGQAILPQIFREPYWTSYGNAAYNPDTGKGVQVYYAYGARPQKEFDAALTELLELRGLGSSWHWFSKQSSNSPSGVVDTPFTTNAAPALSLVQQWQATNLQHQAEVGDVFHTNGFVYVGGEGKISKVSIRDGKVAWSYETGQSYQPSHPVSNGRIVLFGTYYGEPLGAEPWSRTWFVGLDDQTGILWWKVPAGQANMSAACFDGNLAFIGAHDKHLYAIDWRRGELRWKTRLGGWISSTPCVHSNTVAVGCHDGNLYFLDRNSGEIRAQIDCGGRIESNPVVANDWLFVSRDIQSERDKLEAEKRRREMLVVDMRRNRIHSTIGSATSLSKKIIVAGKDVYFFDRTTLFAFDSELGNLAWKASAPAGMTPYPLVMPSHVVLAMNQKGRDGEHFSKVVILDRSTGKQVAEHERGGIGIRQSSYAQSGDELATADWRVTGYRISTHAAGSATNAPAAALNDRGPLPEQPPLLDKERPYESITAAAAALIARYWPDAKVTTNADSFKASHATQEFQSKDKAGGVSSSSHKQTVPSAEGFILTIRRMDQPYTGSATLPWTVREPHWSSYGNAGYDYGTRKGVELYYSHGEKLNKEFHAAASQLLALPGLGSSFFPAHSYSSNSPRRVVGPPFTGRLLAGEIELLGVSEFQKCSDPSLGVTHDQRAQAVNKTWWRPDGSLLNEKIPHITGALNESNRNLYEIALRVRGQGNGVPDVIVKGVPWSDECRPAGISGAEWARRVEDMTFQQTLSCKPGLQTARIRVGVASEAWQTRRQFDLSSQASAGGDEGSVLLSVDGAGEETVVTCRYEEQEDLQTRLVVLGQQGEVAPLRLGSVQRVGSTSSRTMVFRTDALQGAKLHLQRRPYRWVEFVNISLKPGPQTRTAEPVPGKTNAPSKP